MSIKIKIIVSIVVVLSTFAAGRFSVQKPTVKTTVATQTDTHIDEKKDTHTITTTTTKKEPNGETDTIQVVDMTTKVHDLENQQADTQIQQTIIPPKTNTLNISGLVGNDFTKGLLAPTYGVSVTKQVLGPMTVGAWGLTNGTIGLSIGLNF
jgi:hypothetical protein